MSDRYARTDPGPATATAFQVRGRFLTALALRIEQGGADHRFYAQLDDQLRKAPQLLLGGPVVLDFANAPDLGNADQLRDLVEKLRRRDMRVFAVQNASGLDAGLLQTLGLIALPPGRDAPPPRETSPTPATEAPAPVRNTVIRSTVRSGQMVVADQGDLTIIGSVAAGAELVAAGNIHVYGPLRGRAMAGCHGNEDAHIFSQSLDAELVAIAGIYHTSEMLEDGFRQRSTHIYLEDERLRMEVIA